MWFKQASIFKLLTPISYDVANLATQLESLAFTPCLPSFPSSFGWESPVEMEEEKMPLALGINGYLMICLQCEEKILPAAVIKQELIKKAKEIEAKYERKLSHKQKLALKDEVIQTLLPRAFSKLSRVYGYIDSNNDWLVIDSNSAPKIEKFTELFKKALNVKDIQPVTSKLGPSLTRWLLANNYPDSFAIEKACVLADPNRQKRVIRCQQQDLFANAIQLMIKDGCEVQQLALSWNDHIHFTLKDDFSLRSMKFQDELIAQAKELEPETQKQQFETDFMIMSESLSRLLKDLMGLFLPNNEQVKGQVEENVAYLATA